MKTFIITLLFLCYIMGSCSILLFGCLYPFVHNQLPMYVPYVLYPICLIIMASQAQICSYFITKLEINKP